LERRERMRFLITYMLVSAIVLWILICTGFCKFEWTIVEPSLKNGLISILYIIAIILVWPIIVLIFIINGRNGRKGRK
jgi:hypothetical protein